MGEAVSTAALTVEDIGEKFPESAGNWDQVGYTKKHINNNN